MPLTDLEVQQDLADRRTADRVFDHWGSTRIFYQDWQDDYDELGRIARNEFVMEYPDGKREIGDPAIPNMVDIASKDRAAVVAATMPQIICQPEGPGDKARERCDKLERIVGGYLQMNRILSLSWDWAFDAMAGGLTVCKVIPDIRKKPSERFPVFTRLKPQLSYPDPVFTRGPGMNSFMYAYEEYRMVVEADYGVTLDWTRTDRPQSEKVEVIERYDDTYFQVVVRSTGRADTKNAMIVQWAHNLGCTPVAIGTSSNIHGTYAGEFASGLGVLETWNRMQTMVLDDAARKAYAEKVTYNVINPDDAGPDARIELEGPDGRYEYVNQPNQPFSNLQILRDLGQSVRASYLLPLARSGDPNESIISAAGINASQTQFNTAVQTTQRLVLGPMLEWAIELGLKGEEVWSPDAEKNVYGGQGHGYRETYTPSKDIKGYRNVRIAYGPMGGIDPINQAVLMQQFHGNGGLSTRRMMELNPMIEDPQREEKQILKEALQNAEIAGLLQRVAAGTLDPTLLAIVEQAVSSDEVSLSEAIVALIPPAPVAPPVAAGTPPGQGSQPVPSQAPGIPGAAGGVPPPQGPTQILTQGTVSGGTSGPTVRSSSQARTGF